MLNQFNVSLWGDEAFSAILSMKPVSQIISIISRDTSPPLYNITEHIWFRFFGTSEIAIRLLSFLYFLIAIFFVYKIGSFLFSRRIGLLGAVMTFFNPFFFVYAFEGRMYSILAAGVAASMYFFARIIFSKNSLDAKDLVGYILSTTWALYSHHFSIFALLVQGLWFLIILVSGKKKIAFSPQSGLFIFKSFIIIGILYIPWMVPLYNQTQMVGSGFWLGKPNLADLRNLIYKYLAEGINHPLSKLSLYLVLLVLVLRRWSRNVKKSLFLVSWFLGPIILTWAVSQKFQSVFFDRYLLYTIPAATLLLSSNARKYTGIVLAVIIPLFLLIDYNYFIYPTKRPFRELAAYVKEVKRGDDFLVNWNSSSHHLWESKYYGIPAPIYIPSGNQLPFFVGTALMEPGDVINKFPDRVQNWPNRDLPAGRQGKPPKIQRIGVITSGNVDEIKLAGYTIEETKTFGDLKFAWYKAP